MAKTPATPTGNTALKAALKAGYVPGMAPVAAPNGNVAPMQAPAPAVQAPATPAPAPLARGAYYVQAPAGTTPIGNAAFITHVQLCNVCSQLPGGSVNMAVAVAGGNGGNHPYHNAKPTPAFTVTSFGGNKYLPLASITAIAQVLSFTGTITAGMLYQRKTRLGLVPFGNGAAGTLAKMQAAGTINTVLYNGK